MRLEFYNAKLAKIVNSAKKNLESQNSELEIPQDFAKFNELIGLPKHPVTFKSTPLMPYQIEFAKLIPQSRNIRFHINKSRQIGVTELISRVLAYQSFFKYKGGKILIIAGTRMDTAGEIMRRFKELFQNIPGTILDAKNSLKLSLKNGTEIEALPSNSDAIRGLTKIKAIFVDESAHFNLIDDSIVLDAILPLVDTNQADLFLVSTPNGRRGFFYEISINENNYHKIQWDYTVAAGFIYQLEEFEAKFQDNTVDVDQEYRCQFTSPRTSIFGDDFDTEDFEVEEL